MKVRTVNFSNYDDDADGYNPELYVLNSVNNSSKVISNYNEKLNCDDANDTFNENKVSMNNETTILNDSEINCDDTDATLNEEDKICTNNKTTILNNSYMNSDDDESYKSNESSSYSDEEDDLKLRNEDYTVKSGGVSKNIDEEDFYGPTFFQRGTHWVCTNKMLFN